MCLQHGLSLGASHTLQQEKRRLLMFTQTHMLKLRKTGKERALRLRRQVNIRSIMLEVSALPPMPCITASEWLLHAQAQHRSGHET